MSRFDEEIKKLIDTVFEKFENNDKDKEWFDYIFFDNSCYVIVESEANGEYFINVNPYFDIPYINMHINADKTYYIHESHQCLDGDEDLIRDLLIDKYGIDEYKEKLKNLL